MIKASISDAFTFITKNDLRTIWARVKARDVPWMVQLGLYGTCGILALISHVGQVALLSTYVIPAYEGMIVNGELINDTLRAKNFTINSTIAWATTNVLVYFLNVMFVFKRGRHHPVKEFLFFTLINGISFIISLVAGPWLIHKFGIPTNIALLTNSVAAALINFIARKFFVFRG